MEEKELYHLLQSLKERLQLIVEEKGSLADPHVVAISQEMDQVIAHIQRNRLLLYKLQKNEPRSRETNILYDQPTTMGEWLQCPILAVPY